MGRKKKFIDKKKSAIFQLLARDSSDPNYGNQAGSDRVFVRLDNNNVSVETFQGNHELCRVAAKEVPNSILADKSDDAHGEEDNGIFRNMMVPQSFAGKDMGMAQPLQEHVRREILELGFPDDGYNYLTHLREIKNTGGGSVFYHNPKFRVDYLPRDVKAYDASRLQISRVNEEPSEKSIYNVASKTTNVRIQKAVDAEVAILLDDSDLSRRGSDVEDLEEDFVVQANLSEEQDANLCNGVNLVEESVNNDSNAQVLCPSAHSKVTDDKKSVDGVTNCVAGVDYVSEKPRVRRIIDEQFDLLECREYGSDDYDDYLADEDESLAEKLKLAVSDHQVMDSQEPGEDKYKVPDDVIIRCKEYAEKFQVEDEEDKDMIFVEESSDESEVWDCETILTTYSNQYNRPRIIEAPKVTRKKKLVEIVSAPSNSSSQVISLKGKEKLPVDSLLGGKRPAAEKANGVGTMRTEQCKRKTTWPRIKRREERTEVKEERREARRIKKEMKWLYKSEAHRAQRVAAISRPSSIHIL